MAAAAARYWTPHQEHAWLPCNLIESTAESLSLQADEDFGGEIITLPAKALATLAQVDPQQEMGVDDVCTLQSVSEAALLHSVRVRYLKNVIYTRVARVLIALNPFRALPIYSSKHTDQYMAASDSTDLPPHIFGLSKDAVQGLRETTRNQAVLISGESGAGKTESAKLVLSFVTEAVRQKSGDESGGGSLVEMVCQTSPVLEAFGNAMTVRNNNSSRFGKWLDLRFSRSLQLLGCSLTSYLLETTRVCSQSSGERGFHVFFQLLQARDSPAIAPLNLKEPGYYRYLQGAQQVAPGVNDAACYEELCESLISVGFDEETRLGIFKAVAGILTLGNVEFKDSDQAELTDPATQKHVAELFGMDAESLTKCMTVKKIKVGLEEMASPLNPDQARAARDALSRLFYGQLFLWLIARINKTLTVGEADASSGSERLLGVLDIAGFESFEFNSLEQLLINLSNEHLQQNFNNVVFKKELKDCEEEGIKPPDNLGFMDNSDVLALIDGKGGVLDVLDEVMAMPKSSNQKYVDNVNKAQAANKRFIKPKIAFMGFGIQHFAGGVTYGAEGWLEKNANRSPPDATQLLASSANVVLADMGKEMLEEEKETAKPARGATKKVKSVTAMFRASLRSLMTKINEADPHYIRCVKPNMEKVPGRIVGRMAMEQLLLSGVLATVRIRQQGYAVRLPHRTFVLDYRVVAWKAGKEKKDAGKIAADEDCKKKAEEVLESLKATVPAFKELGGGCWAVGTTKVFMNLEAARIIDDARSKALFSMVVKIQSVARGYRARKQLRPKREIAEGIRSLLRSSKLDAPSQTVLSSKPELKRSRTSTLRRSTAWTGQSVIEPLGDLAKAREVAQQLGGFVEKADALSFQNIDVMKAKLVQRRLTLEADTMETLQGLMTSLDPVEMDKAIARGAGLRLPRSMGLGALEERVDKLREQQPLVQALTTATENFSAGTHTEEAVAGLEEVVKALDDAGIAEGDWLPELKGREMQAEVRKRLSEAKAALAASAAEAEKAAAVSSWPPWEAPPPPTESTTAAKADDAPPPSSMGKVGRSRTRTVSFNSDGMDEPHLRKELKKARDTMDAKHLEILLRRVDELGMQDEAEPADGDSDGEVDGIVTTSKQVFEQLQAVDFIMSNIETTSQEVAHSPSVEALRRLENLSRQLRKLPGYELEAAEADSSLRRGLLKRSQETRRKSVFESRDAVELELATSAFSKLTDYPLLKQVWAGKQKPAPGSAAHSTNGVIAHSKACLDEAMTMVPEGQELEAYEAAAVQNFRNVLVCMGDRPAQECQRQASREAILELATVLDDKVEECSMRNEVYIQVMKQLVACPRERTARLGWGLLQKLCMQAPPVPETAEFVRHLINGFLEARPGDRDSAATARSCLHILDGSEEGELHLAEDTSWTPGAARLKTENARLRAHNKKLAWEVQKQAAEVERLIAEVVRLGGNPNAGPRTAPLRPAFDSDFSPATEDQSLGELRRQAVSRGMLARQASGHNAEELMKWLKNQATAELPAPMASAPSGGPSQAGRFMAADSDSDVEIDLSAFAEGSPTA